MARQREKIVCKKCDDVFRFFSRRKWEFCLLKFAEMGLTIPEDVTGLLFWMRTRLESPGLINKGSASLKVLRKLVSPSRRAGRYRRYRKSLEINVARIIKWGIVRLKQKCRDRGQREERVIIKLEVHGNM